MANFTDYGETMLCNFIRGTVPTLPAQFDVALLTAVTDNSFTEVSWSGYARKQIARSMAAWAGTQGTGTQSASTGTSHTTSNNVAINFGIARADATVVALGLFAGTNMIAYSPMQNELQVQNGDPVIVQAGNLVFTLGAVGGMTDYLSNKMIDFIWRGQTFTYPNVTYLALNTSMPTNALEGAEVSGDGYNRVTVNSSAWRAPTDGTISNNVNLSFAVPASDWGNVIACSLYDAQTSGNLLWWAAVDSPKTIVNGAGAPEFLAGSLQLQVL